MYRTYDNYKNTMTRIILLHWFPTIVFLLHFLHSDTVGFSSRPKINKSFFSLVKIIRWKSPKLNHRQAISRRPLSTRLTELIRLTRRNGENEERRKKKKKEKPNIFLSLSLSLISDEASLVEHTWPRFFFAKNCLIQFINLFKKFPK